MFYKLIDMEIKNKTILLTGASRGIGGELAKQLLKEGANLILVARDLDVDTEALKHVVCIKADLTTDEGIKKVASSVKDRVIDVLINMAGIGIYKPIEELDVSDLETSLNINVVAPFQLIKICYRSLQQSDIGLVLNIGSGAGTMPFKARSAYCASKYALRGLSLSLSEEHADRKPEFCLITLGSTMTTFGGKDIEDQKRKVKEGQAIFPTEYVAKELIKIIKSPKREAEIVLYPSEHGFGEWKKP